MKTFTATTSTVVMTLLLLLCSNLSVLASPPTTNATNLTFSSIDGDRATLTWTNGNGTKRLVVVRKDQPVTATPVNGVTYTANAKFGDGDALGTEQYVVYNNSATSFTLTGLTPSHTYYVAIYEYTGDGFQTEYLTTNPGTASVTALSAPTVQPSNITGTNITGNSIKISFTKGNGARRIVVIREGAPVNTNPTNLVAYNGNPGFGLGSHLGNGNYVLMSSTPETVTATNLEPGKTYHFAVFEYNGNAGPVYLTTTPPTASFTTAPRPSVASSAMTFSNIDGITFQMAFTTGNGSRRLVIAKAGSPVTATPVDGENYTASNTFGNGQQIAPGEFVLSNNTNSQISLLSLQHSTTYHFAVFEYDGTGSNTRYLTASFLTGSRSTAVTPTVEASNVIITNITSNQATITCTKGNGDRRIILVREGSPVDALPVNLVHYSAHANFGVGSQVGTGNYAVYYNTGNTITVNNLSPEKTYHVAVVEANGANNPVYLTTAPATGSFFTTLKPTIPASNMTFTSVDGASMDLSWTTGNGTRRIVIARAGAPVSAVPVDGTNYTASSTLTSGQEILPGEYVVTNSTASSLQLKGLAPNTVYHFAVFEYTISSGLNYYLTSQFLASSRSTSVTPALAASNVVISDVTSNSAKITWTNGDGGRRLVIAKAGSSVDATLNNLTYYTPNLIFGSGNHLGNGNFSIYSSTGNTATVTGLQPNTQYHFAVYEYNGNNNPVYLQTAVPRSSTTTEVRPTQPCTAAVISAVEGNAITLQWTNGTGTKRIVVAKKGAPVSAAPVDGTTYTSNTTFGNGTQLLPGEFVVYNGSSSSVEIKGLEKSTIYHFAVYEADGSGSAITYLTSAFLSAQGTTLNAPTVQSSNVLFSNITSSTATVTWTNGNGSNRIVIARKGSPVTAVPVDFVNYSASTAFGNQTLTTGQFIIFKGAGTNVGATNLEPGTTYHFAVYEMNGLHGPVYQLANPAVGSVTTLGPPLVAAQSIVFNSPASTSVEVRWTNGSGQRRIVVAREAAPTDFVPANTTTYTANSFFGTGQAVGTNSFVVFDGTSDHVTVTNLQREKVYYFTVYEYNQFPTGPAYLTANAPTAMFNGVLLPVTWIDVQAKHVLTGVEVKWTIEEVNNSRFEIERSSNGSSYRTIATVASRGSGRHTYTINDVNHPSGTNYYRIKQVDKDGQSSYSAVVKVVATVNHVMVIEQPVVTHSLKIQLPQLVHGSSVVITDMSGKKVAQAAVNNTVLELPVAHLSAGLYNISLLQSNQLINTKRFVKQ
ncbi:fibronectin type III domain-containing protein [Aridibaculum aurantiacum]|uniref:fibronectin type III domain-containing protein n=1 Tax=Aridibaculum aurantiacum TaxID=2810307 RepID=UPI001A96A136|nr:T9SS type A sorting domain-containing protein [Aridibaculum aurantiacum]